MIEISITEEHKKFIDIYAEKQTIGGFSNLASKDLSKASRNDYQKTGVAGEISWFLFRENKIDRLKEILDFKFKILRPQNKGDNGFDDQITSNGKTRYVDIKTSYTEDEERIKYLNLVIPEREFHQNMIYVCAFTIGESRININKVILAGWAITEDVHKKWKYDAAKWCVPVSDLRDMKELEIYIR
jgi:hypothetical protein